MTSTRNRGRGLALAPAIAAALMLAGCGSVPRAPTVIRHVAASDIGPQHPTCFQARTCRAPKAFLVTNEADWRKVWGPGEDPPVINFEKDMVFAAYCSIGSEGPGNMDVWVLKYRDLEDVLEVRVKQLMSGAWPLSAAYSRAYELVKLPQTDKPVKVLWQYVWGTRDEQSELQAREWTPEAAVESGGGTGSDFWRVPQ